MPLQARMFVRRPPKLGPLFWLLKLALLGLGFLHLGFRA